MDVILPSERHGSRWRGQLHLDPEDMVTLSRAPFHLPKLFQLAFVSKQLPRLALEHRRSVEAEFCVGDDPVAVNPQYGRCSGHTALAMDLGPIQQESMFEPIFADEATDEVRLVFIPDADGENNKTFVFELFEKVAQVRSLRTGDISVLRPEGENDRPSTELA